MKIQCPACNASYRLPDDRIQGKNRIFKISCKKCGAEIRVRGVETVDDMGRTTMPFALELPAAAPVPLSQQQVWFAGIDGKQLGPMTEGEVGDHIREGRLGPSDLVWKKGFSQWMPVREVSPFDDLVTDAVPATPDAAKPAEKRSPRRAQTLELSAAMIELLVKLDGQSEQGDAAGNAIVVPPELPPLAESQEVPLKFGLDRGSAIAGAEDESNVADTTISTMPVTATTAAGDLPPAVPNAEAGKTGKVDAIAKSGAASIKVRLPEGTAEPERKATTPPTSAATNKQPDKPASIVVKPAISLPTTPSRPSIQPVEPARPATAPTRPGSSAPDKSATPTVNATKPATGPAGLTKTTPPPVGQGKPASATPAKPSTIVPTPAKPMEQRPSTGKALETKTPIGRPSDPVRPADLGRSGRPVPKKKGNTGLVVAAAVAVVVVLVVVGVLALQSTGPVPEKVEAAAVVPAPQLAAVVAPPAPPPVAEVVAATAGVVGADAGAGVQAAAIAVPEPAVAVIGAGPDATDAAPDVAAAAVAVVEPAKEAPAVADKPVEADKPKAEKVAKAEKTEKAAKPDKAEAKVAEKPKMSDDDVERLLQKQRDKDKAKADQEAAAAAKAAKKGTDDAERQAQKQRDKDKAKADQEAAAAAKAAKKADDAERVAQKQRDKDKAKADQEAAAAAKTAAKKGAGDDDEIDRILAKHDKKSPKEDAGGEEASGLSQSLINTIAAKVNKKVLTCVMLGDVEGETALKVSVTVNSDGSVMNAAVQGKFAKTPVAHCVSDAVKTLVFPQSSGPAKKYTLKYAVGS